MIVDPEAQESRRELETANSSPHGLRDQPVTTASGPETANAEELASARTSVTITTAEPAESRTRISQEIAAKK